jgi:zinc transporter ZupT
LQLTELTGIAGAIAAGLLIGLGIWPGVLIGRFAKLSHATIARVTGFGAGATIAVVAFELVAQASTEAGLGVVMPAFLGGCALFGLFNAWLARRGAKHRKRCGECVRQTSESEQPAVAPLRLSARCSMACRKPWWSVSAPFKASARRGHRRLFPGQTAAGALQRGRHAACGAFDRIYHRAVGCRCPAPCSDPAAGVRTAG